MNFEDMYICDKVYLYCEKGEFIQPLSISYNKNTKIQGVLVATENDNLVGKNFPHFGENCKCGGKCKLVGTIKWQNVKTNVKINGACLLTGGSYFICPDGQKVTISEHNQINMNMQEEAPKDTAEDAAKTPNPMEIYKQLEELFKDPEKREVLLTALEKQLDKETEYMKEYAIYKGVDFVGDPAEAIQKLWQDPSLDTFEKALIEYGTSASQILPVKPNQMRAHYNMMMNDYEKAKKGGYAPPTIKEFANDYVEELFYIEGVDPEDIGTKISPEATEWAKNVHKQIYLGNGTMGETTLIGTGGEIVMGCIPVAGQILDVRDVLFSAVDKDGWGGLYSAIGLIPAAGEMVKRSPALMDLVTKLMSKTDNIVESVAKAGAKMENLLKQSKRVVNAMADTFESAKGLVRLAKAKAILKIESFLVYASDVLSEILDMVLCQYLKYGCFSEGTLVKTENGLKPIENIKIGEKIYTYNVEKDINEIREVTRTYSKIVNSTIKIELEDGEVIETTPEHPFYDEDFNYYEAQELKEGISLFGYKESAVIKSVEKIEFKEQLVYNLETEENHNFFVGESEVLVHNDDVCQRILKGISKQIDDAIKRGDEVIKLKGYPNSKIMENGGIKKGILDSKGVPHDIKYNTKVIEVEIDGKKIKVEANFPDFGDVKVKGADVELPKELLIASDEKQFKYVTEQLKKLPKKELEKMFDNNKEVIDAIKRGDTRIPGYTYHHNEGTGVIEVIDAAIHDGARHVGGNAIHGQGVR